MLDISLEADIFVTDALQKFLQEVDIILNTKLTSVLGEPRFGSEFEQFLWSLKDNTYEVENYVRRIIEQHTSLHNLFNWDVGCTFIYDKQEKEFYLILFGVEEPKSGKFIKKTYIMHNYDARPSEQALPMNHK